MKKLFLFVALAFLFAGCADVTPVTIACTGCHEYGFWGGLWHGIVLPFSWFGSLISDNIAVWAINNNGGWYVFGFALGAGGVGSLLNMIIGIFTNKDK